MQLYTIFIGSNNTTKVLDMFTIEHETAKRFDGFTLSNAVGYWKGSKEDMARLEIAIDDSNSNQVGQVYSLAKTLRDVLSQDAVMMTVRGEVSFI